MTRYAQIWRLITVAAMLAVPIPAFAQTPTTTATTTPPPGKPTIKTDMVPSLFVMNASGASLQGSTLTLTVISPDSIVFADRPIRAAGHLLTEHLLEEWTVGSFAKDAPNATVSVLSKDGASVRDAVVELKIPPPQPRRHRTRLTGIRRLTIPILTPLRIEMAGASLREPMEGRVR